MAASEDPFEMVLHEIQDQKGKWVIFERLFEGVELPLFGFDLFGYRVMFILVCNLLGLVPFLGSATASIWVTGALALCAFVVMHGAGLIARGNPIAYLASLWPKLDLGAAPVARIGGFCLSLPLFVIELM